MATLDGSPVETDGRTIWRRFAEHYYLFRGTPTRLWFDHVLAHLFGIDEPLNAATADRHYDTIATLLQRDDFPPARLVRALQHRGHRDDRRRARRSQMAQDDPRQRLAGPRRHRLPAGCASSIPTSKGFRPISTGSARSPAATPAAGPAISTPIASGAPSSRALARPRPITAIRRRETANLSDAAAEELFNRVRHGSDDERETRAVSRPDADRDGQDEPRRRAGPADPSRLLAQSLAGHFPEVRPRQGLRYPDPNRLCGGAEAAARLRRAGARPDHHSLHARRDQLCARTGAARRRLSGAEARAGLVVPRQSRKACAASAR